MKFNESLIAENKVLAVLGFALRNKDLIFDQAISMGLKSGEQAGRNIIFTPESTGDFITSFALWTEELSSIKLSPFFNIGVSSSATYFANNSQFSVPLNTKGARMPDVPNTPIIDVLSNLTSGT